MITVFSTSPSDRCFEDYVVGGTYYCGSFTMTETEIIKFARRYDPQTMHIDRTAAAAGPFGEVIASGWHTIANTMRLVVDNFLPSNGLAAPGIDELRWPLPVRPLDTLTLHATIQSARRSNSRPDRGLLQTLLELTNQKNELVMTLRPTNFVRVRGPC